MSLNLQKDHSPIEGNWWIPSDPAMKWHGVLRLEASKMATLRLLEYGKSFTQSGINRLPASRKVIHGITKEDRPVTLIKCFSSVRTRSSGSQEIEFDVQNVVMGGHFEEADLLFDEIQVEFDYLDDWITYSRFEAKDETTLEEQKGIRILFSEDHQIPFQIPEYSESLFYVGYRSDYSAFKFSIESRANLQITFPQKQTLGAILKELKKWEWFLTLATSHKNHPVSLMIHREDLRFNLGDKSHKKPYDVWVATDGKRDNRKALHPPDMAFTFPNIRQDFSSIISKWTALQTPWAAVLHRYFASIHRKGIQLQEQFLFRAQALEAMARADSNGSALTQKIAYGAAWEAASPSLQKKLGEKDIFVEAVRINRNYLTHYSPADEEKAFEFAELFGLTQKMGFLLEAIIFRRIGLSETLVDRAIGERRWGYLVEFDED